MKVIETAWRSYAEAVIPAAAPEWWRTECRRVFYAGARGLLSGMLNFVSIGDEPTDADMANMESIHRELDEFVKDLEEGRA
jgi:hypothetical protein